MSCDTLPVFPALQWSFALCAWHRHVQNSLLVFPYSYWKHYSRKLEGCAGCIASVSQWNKQPSCHNREYFKESCSALPRHYILLTYNEKLFMVYCRRKLLPIWNHELYLYWKQWKYHWVIICFLYGTNSRPRALKYILKIHSAVSILH